MHTGSRFFRNRLGALLGLALWAAAACSNPNSTSLSVGPQGGVLTTPAGSPLVGVTLTVPPGAFLETTLLTVQPCAPEIVTSEQVALSACVAMFPSGTLLAKPATLVLPYSPDKLPMGKMPMVMSRVMGQVAQVPATEYTLDAAKGTITLSVSRLGDFQVVAEQGVLPDMTTGPDMKPLPTKNLDVLFVIDNSPSMSPKQQALAQAFPTFVKALTTTGLNYHIGIVSTDVGTRTTTGLPWGGAIGTCDTLSGDDGLLQNTPCTSRVGVSSEAAAACTSLCPDTMFVPRGARYISSENGVTNVPVSMVLDPMTGKMVDAGPQRAFQCIGFLGDGGCGIESPLEAMKRALDNHLFENSGFLRADSMLAIVFITDEDDCSVQLARRSENNPTIRDCSTTQPDNYDCYNIDYRCLARSVQCTQSLLTTGVKTGCKERADNYLEPVDKYVTFLNGLRGSSRLLISGIWTPPTLLTTGSFTSSYSGGSTTPFLNRATGTAAACTFPSDSSRIGQAQRRLSDFGMKLAATEQSICDPSGYPKALTDLAAAIVQRTQ